MIYQPRPRGTYVTVNGKTYPATLVWDRRKIYVNIKAEANPDTSLFQWDDQYQEWHAQPEPVDCSEIFELYPRARYKGHLCDVDRFNDDGTVDIAYTGSEGSWLQREGFSQPDKGIWTKSVPASDLYDYYEEHAVPYSLFLEWREREFEQPPEGDR